MIAVPQIVTDLTQDRFIPKIVGQVYNGNVLTMLLSERRRQTWRGGTQIVQPVFITAPTTGGSYSGFDVFTTTQETKTTQAKFDPSQLYWNVTLSGIQLAINQGEAAVIDLVANELDIAAEGLKQEMGTQVYGDGTGNSSKDLLGLLAAVDDTTVVKKMASVKKLSYMLEQLVRSFVLTPSLV